MILRSAPPSPFGRKVKIAALELGLMEGITVENTDTMSAEDSIRTQNPLGKIPTLILDSGEVLYDSRVIVEYLDHLTGGGKIIPKEPQARFASLKLQALADGIMDAAILQIYEQRWREEHERSARWVAHQQGKVERALLALEAAPPGEGLCVGTISTACALGYLDLRFGGEWRTRCPNLTAWLEGFAQRFPSFEKTKVVG